MILLKISNSSELVSSKLGEFIERLTPGFLDDSTVEDLVIKRMIENLSKEGIKGEITSLSGLSVEGEQLIVNEGLGIVCKDTLTVGLICGTPFWVVLYLGLHFVLFMFTVVAVEAVIPTVVVGPSSTPHIGPSIYSLNELPVNCM